EAEAPAQKPAKLSESSEFELTLDDGAGLAPAEAPAAGAEKDKDIFETDFEMPALEEDSGVGEMDLAEGDTELESSDFDLALSDEEQPVDMLSSSEVMDLSGVDESAEVAAPAARKPAKKAAAKAAEDEEISETDELLSDESFDDLSTEEAEEETEPVPAV